MFEIKQKGFSFHKKVFVFCNVWLLMFFFIQKMA